MISTCITRERSAYQTGRLAPGDDRLFRPGGLELTARAMARAGLGVSATVLDIGCGAGDSVRYLRSIGIDAIGVDSSALPAEANCRELSAFERIIAPAESLPFPDSAVDGVLAECSLSLIVDRERALAECARVLKFGGRMMISDLYARNPEAIVQVRSLRGSCAAGMIIRNELETSLCKAGFVIDVWEDHSQALRECAARFLFEYGSLDGLWGCNCDASSQAVQDAMRAARAGYFLLIATRLGRGVPEGDGDE